MNDRLIEELVLDLRPVRRLRSPGVRLLYFAVLAVPSLIATASFLGPRADLSQILGNPSYVLETLLLVILCYGATLAALRSGVPGAELTAAARLLTLGVVLWALAVAARGFSSSMTFEPKSGFSCLRRSLLLVTPLAWALFAMVRRAAPLDQRLSSALVMVSSSTLVMLATRVLCARDDALHALTWHIGPVVLLSQCGWCFGRRWLRASRSSRCGLGNESETLAARLASARKTRSPRS